MRASISIIWTYLIKLFSEKGLIAVHFLRGITLRGIFIVLSRQKNIRGPHEAHGPDVAQACFKVLMKWTLWSISPTTNPPVHSVWSDINF